MATFKDCVRIYGIVHNLLHFEGSAPQGGEADEGTVLLCQKIRPYRNAYYAEDNRKRTQYGGVYELAATGDDPIAAMEQWIRDTLKGSSALAVEVTVIEPGPIDHGQTLPAISFVPVHLGTTKAADGVIACEYAQYRISVEA